MAVVMYVVVTTFSGLPDSAVDESQCVGVLE
jgi:hypothetical protein